MDAVFAIYEPILDSFANRQIYLLAKQTKSAKALTQFWHPAGCLSSPVASSATWAIPSFENTQLSH